MRILYFTRNYTSHDYRFLSVLAKSHHKIYYLRLEKNTPPLEKRSLPSEVEIVEWQQERSWVTLWDGYSLLIELKSIIKTIKPDLIQAGPIQRTALLVALTGFQPLVTMSWGYDLLIDAKRNPFWGLATRYTLKKSAVLIADCDTLFEEAIRYGMPKSKIITFPWGIDLKHFSLQKNSAPKKGDPKKQTPFIILSTRSWEPIYGVDTIAKAFVIAAQKRSDIRLIMLGNGSQSKQIYKIFKEGGLIGNKPLENRVLFPGQIGFDELPEYYQSADLYVSASHSDGTSISLLEAMACGTPAIVSDIPGNREWIMPNHNGWLFPESDANALAEIILNAIEKPTKLYKMGRTARYLVEKRADWTKNSPMLFKAFDIALKDYQQ